MERLHCRIYSALRTFSYFTRIIVISVFLSKSCCYVAVINKAGYIFYKLTGNGNILATKYSKRDLYIIFFQESCKSINGNLNAKLLRKTICARSKKWECNGITSVVFCQLQSFFITRTKTRFLAFASIRPPWTTCMNDVLCIKIKCISDCYFARHQKTNLLTCFKKFFLTSGFIYGRIYTISNGNVRICRIYYSICFYFCYVISNNLKRQILTSLLKSNK